MTDLWEGEIQEGFVIDNDTKADWAIRKISAERNETERLIEIANNEIAMLEAKKASLLDKCEKNTSYLQSLLMAYFDSVEHKQTQTQESYKLLNGTLVRKKARKSITKDDSALVSWLKANNRSEYVKVTETPVWGEFKKGLEINNGVVIDTATGAVVEGVNIEDIPETFEVKI